jgi:putative ABC transport system permease protein
MINGASMFKSYLLTASRYLLRNKAFNCINIGGLIIGLAACLLIGLYVQSETSYDRHWRNSDAIYRINQQMTFPDEVEETAPTSLLLLPALRQYFGEQIENGTRITWMPGQIQIEEQGYLERINLVDIELPQIFQLQVSAGDIQTVLADTNTIALSKRTAELYFGAEPAVGRVVSFRSVNAEPVEYRVGAVYELPQGNTTLQLDNFVLLDDAKIPDTEGWLTISAETYVQLHPDLLSGEFASQLAAFVDASVNLAPYELPAGQAPSEVLRYYPQPVREIYFNPVANPNFPTIISGDSNMVAVFAMISVLILLVGIANFVILSTARATERAREVGVRKVSGASRAQVVMQFVGESLLFSSLAVISATALVELLLPLFGTLTGKQLAIAYDSSATWLALAGLLLLTGVTGGIYPAVVLSDLRWSGASATLQLLRREVGVGLRNFLMLFQFSISIGLVIATAVVYAQLLYLGKIEPGFNPERLLVVENMNSREISAGKNTFRQEILALPGVTNAAYSSNQPNNVGSGGVDVGLFRPRGSTGPGFGVAALSIGTDFFETYQIPVLSGRTFIDGRDPEQLRPNRMTPAERENYQNQQKHVVLNETAARAFGFDPPAAATDHYIQTAGSDGEFRDVLVIGVVADAQFIDLHVRPVAEVYQFFPEIARFITLRYQGEQQDILESVERVWQRHMGDALFVFSFVEQNLAQVFTKERNEARILATFTLLALSIACLGLFGSAAFSTALRTREIGVRKVMGAQVWQIVRLLLWQFSRPVLLANLVAWPLATWAMVQWLKRFPYQLELWMLVPICLLSALIALCIAWLAVGSTAAKAASASPALALRYE